MPGGTEEIQDFNHNDLHSGQCFNRVSCGRDAGYQAGSEDKMCFHMSVLALCLHNEGLHTFFARDYRTINSGKIRWTGHDKARMEKIKNAYRRKT
jgi:hypothetical protein